MVFVLSVENSFNIQATLDKALFWLEENKGKRNKNIMFLCKIEQRPRPPLVIDQVWFSSPIRSSLVQLGVF